MAQVWRQHIWHHEWQPELYTAGSRSTVTHNDNTYLSTLHSTCIYLQIGDKVMLYTDKYSHSHGTVA